MKKEKTLVVSFRVNESLVPKIDQVADEIPRGSRQKVLQTVFMPAFNRYFRQHEKKKIAVIA
jgi:hypothetical protein